MGRETFRYASNFSQDGAELHYKNKYIFCFLLFHFITFLVTLLKSGRVWNTWVWHRFSVRPKISWKALTISTYYPSLHMSGPRKVANKSLWRILTPWASLIPMNLRIFPNCLSRQATDLAEFSSDPWLMSVIHMTHDFCQWSIWYKECWKICKVDDLFAEIRWLIWVQKRLNLVRIFCIWI